MAGSGTDTRAAHGGGDGGEAGVRNFYAGPGALPQPVLRRIQAELLDYRGLGMSVMELSHRSEAVLEMIDATLEQLRRLLRLGPDHEVLLLQGGASLQFVMLPMNLSPPGGKVDYVHSGYWTAKAIDEARRLGRDVAVAASSAPDHRHIPAELTLRPDASYLHLCTNNTVEGTQWHDIPEVAVPLVADMSSDILSRDIDATRFACLYAHAQKTLGPAGVTVAVLRRDMLERIPPGLPAMLDYRTHLQHRSNFNTPPVFAIHVVHCVLDWLEHEVGGVAAMEALNRRKATLLYAALDGSGLFRCPVAADSRSAMNVVFHLPTPALEARFVAEAAASGLVGLAGHRSVGGCRASLYNAVTLEAVEDLVAFMHAFERRCG
jgi:phosphoserine aminotransferase